MTIEFGQLHRLISIASPDRRVVHERGGYRIAGGASWIGRAVNWLKETFFPAMVKKENAAAYTAARDDWKTAHQDVEQQNKPWFDTKMKTFEGSIRAGVPLTVKHLTELLETVAPFSEDTHRTLETELSQMMASGPKETSRPSGTDPVNLNATMWKDIPRASYSLNGTELPKNPDDLVDAMRKDGLDSDMIKALSHVAHQGSQIATFTALMNLDGQSPLTPSTGEKVSLLSLPKQNSTYAFRTQADGSVLVDVTLACSQPDPPYHSSSQWEMQQGSKFDINFRFVVQKTPGSPDGYEIGDVSRPTCRSQITGWIPPAGG